MLAGRRKAVDPLPHIQTQTYAPVYTKPNHVYHNSPLPDSPIQDSPIQDSPIQDSPFSRTPRFPGLPPTRTTPIQDSPMQVYTLPLCGYTYIYIYIYKYIYKICPQKLAPYCITKASRQQTPLPNTQSPGYSGVHHLFLPHPEMTVPERWMGRMHVGVEAVLWARCVSM